MKNGEGASEETSRVASPDPFDARSSKSDGGDSDGDASLSRYSSCGESEMERYCSANSVMGTSSLCSSVSYIDCLGSDFGSFRSSGFGDDGSLEGFSLGGRQENNFEDRRLRTSPHCGSRIGVYKEELENDELKLSDGATRTDCGTQRELRLTTVSNNLNVGVRDGNRVVLVMDQGHDNPRGITDSSAHVSTKGLGFHGRLNSQDSMQMDGAERGQEGEEDSFACGHSEDEDSMYNYGSDDEHRKSSYLSKTQSSHYWETKDKDINSLVMNSSVAFGSDDWDDFVQETGVAANDLFMLDMVEGQREGFHEKGSNCPDDTQTAQGHMADLSVACEELQSADEGVSSPTNHTLTPVASGRLWEIEQIQVRDGTPGESPNVDKLAVNVRNSSMDKVSPQNFDDPHEKVVRDRVRAADESEEYLSACCIINVFEMDQGQTMEKDCLELEVRPDASLLGGEKQHSNTENLTGMNDGQSFEGKEMQFDQAFNPLSDVNINQLHDDTPSSTLESGYTSKLEDFMRPKDLIVDQTLQTKTETVELNEFIDDVIHEMEEILLDSAESPGSRFPVFPHEKKTSLSQVALPSRDGGLTASTSGQDDVDAFSRKVMRIDGVEVIGARQKKGNVSLSERLVGVREYTVYRIKVWSGEDSWEVERRYRDFLTLYHRLKELFADQGWSLPSPWSSIDKESRKFFGSASPDVVTERSAMIQECLRSVLHSWFLSSTPKALIWFLSPQYSNLGSAESGTLVHQSSDVSEGTNSENLAPLGKTISLVLEVRPPKSIKQMLEAQHYCCAGCHKSFDDGKNLMIDLAQTFGWGKPRLCEYTGQLYCSSCHLNDVAVLPARVLHHWDFVEYPVCQLAKSYLDSIHDQPMLCVSAVNPFLFSKVPALLHVTSLRKKIASMLPCVRCPFRRSINRGFGSRKYLLESNDFFALRDLIDLSKGAFAALPVKLETVSKKIQEHITEQCLICCDVGLPCGARQACNDPSSLIFPFQEDEVEKCRSCEQLYHKPCFKKLGTCPCRSHQEVYEDPGSFKMENDGAINDINGALILPRSRSGSALTSSLFSGLFSKTKSGSSKMKDRRESDTVILMGSLPSTTL